MKRKIKFAGYGKRWFDRVNGNTYHSVRIVRVSDGAILHGKYQYGYGDQYRETALEEMARARWLPKKYLGKKEHHLYERENGYPIEWFVSDGLKRDCIANGKP